MWYTDEAKLVEEHVNNTKVKGSLHERNILVYTVHASVCVCVCEHALCMHAGMCECLTIYFMNVHVCVCLCVYYHLPAAGVCVCVCVLLCSP